MNSAVVAVLFAVVVMHEATAWTPKLPARRLRGPDVRVKNYFPVKDDHWPDQYTEDAVDEADEPAGKRWISVQQNQNREQTVSFYKHPQRPRAWPYVTIKSPETDDVTCTGEPHPSEELIGWCNYCWCREPHGWVCTVRRCIV